MSTPAVATEPSTATAVEVDADEPVNPGSDETSSSDGFVAPQGLEVLVPGSSYTIVKGAVTQADIASLRAVIPAALDQYYKALRTETERSEAVVDEPSDSS